MKKLLILLLIVTTLTAKSQTTVYHPFPTTYGTWNYRFYNEFGNPTSMFSSFILSGDTTIANINYKKIYNGNYVGALREESKIIYFVPDTSSSEYLLYNFNLNKGDTIFHPFGGSVCEGDTITIEAVDTILIENGYYRRLYVGSHVHWIEGIGSDIYFLEPANDLCVSGNFYIECMTGDDGIVFGGVGSFCITSVSEQSKNSESISFYPNPFTNKLSFTTNTNEPSEIILYDITSRKLIQQQFTNSVSINTNQLTKGIYLYEVSNKNGVIKKGKVIKE